MALKATGAQSSRAPGDAAGRGYWMSVLARASLQDLETAWRAWGRQPSYVWLREPEAGLVMVRARAGGTGRIFNLGEMSVTRCTLKLADGTVGFAYVQGRSSRHAELAAMMDALLQQDRHRPTLMAQVVEPLRAIQARLREERSRKAAATKVEFFTMVRGENAA